MQARPSRARRESTWSNTLIGSRGRRSEEGTSSVDSRVGSSSKLRRRMRTKSLRSKKRTKTRMLTTLTRADQSLLLPNHGALDPRAMCCNTPDLFTRLCLASSSHRLASRRTRCLHRSNALRRDNGLVRSLTFRLALLLLRHHLLASDAHRLIMVEARALCRLDRDRERDPGYHTMSRPATPLMAARDAKAGVTPVGSMCSIAMMTTSQGTRRNRGGKSLSSR